jgi:S1/P1 Nuclease
VTVTAIRTDFEVLSSNNASQAEKLKSLMFLGHWIGDIHQPLHVSFEDDRGGNGVLVTGECDTSNLHSAWDTFLAVKAVGEDVDEAATELMKTITPARIEGWSHDARRRTRASTSPSLPTARHMYMPRPATVTTISSRCHRSCATDRPRLRFRAIAGPNISTHRRMVSLLILNPSSARRFSTSR